MLADPLHLSRHQTTPSPPPLSSSCSSHRSAKLKTSNPCNHRNQQYSIIGLTNAAGTLVERYSYTAYGTLGIYDPSGTVRTTSTYANRYTYTGREYDPDLNLYHFRARWYDPATGGFISRDPLGYVDGMSLYRGYFGATSVDPSGYMSHIAGGALIGCAANAGYSAVTSIFTGDTICKGCCKGIVACLFGALGGAIATAAPAYAGCAYGLVSGITSSVTGDICNWACGTPDNSHITCAVITAITNGLLGCLVKAGAAADPSREGLTKWLWNLVSRITGHDISAICKFAMEEDPFFGGGRGDGNDEAKKQACKKRGGDKFHWLLDRRLYNLCTSSCG